MLRSRFGESLSHLKLLTSKIKPCYKYGRRNIPRLVAITLLGTNALTASFSRPPALCKELSAPFAPTPSHKSIRKRQRAFWRRLRRKMKVWVEMLIRSIYLGLIFAPAAITLPFAVIQGLDKEKGGKGDWWWNWLRECVRQSGPCNIKFSQWLSQRPDLFPLLLCDQLRDLQVNASTHSIKHSLRALEKAFGRKWSETITLARNEHDEPVIIGSGCIAQVFRGRLKKQKKGGGEEEHDVAVKVVHPRAAKSIAADTNIMLALARLIELLPGTDSLSLHESVQEFTKLMLSQLDLRNEAKSLKEFRKNFAISTSAADGNNQYRRRVRFPGPLAVSKSVLVETFEEGETIAEAMKAIESDHQVRSGLAQVLLDAILKMTFEDNYIHADLHSGNIIVRGLRNGNVGESGGITLSLIDTGLVAALGVVERRDFLDLFRAVVQNQGALAGRLMIERNKHPRNETMPRETRAAFEGEVAALVQEVHSSGLSLGRIGVAALLQKLLVACYRHQVKLESKFVSTILAIGVVEGLGRRLDPDVDVLQKAAPYIVRASLSSLSSNT